MLLSGELETHLIVNLAGRISGSGGVEGSQASESCCATFLLKRATATFIKAFRNISFGKGAFVFQLNLFSFPVHGAAVLHSPAVVHLERPPFGATQRT